MPAVDVMNSPATRTGALSAAQLKMTSQTVTNWMTGALATICLTIQQAKSSSHNAHYLQKG